MYKETTYYSLVTTVKVSFVVIVIDGDRTRYNHEDSNSVLLLVSILGDTGRVVYACLCMCLCICH